MMASCKNNLEWHYLFSIFCIWKSGVVYAGNLALRQPSQLSSVFDFGGGKLLFASYAVDGYPVGTVPERCAVSQHKDNPYWIVDLGRTYIIDEVFLIGRSDSCCFQRMFGSEIRIGDLFEDGGTSNPKCTDIPSYSGQLKKAFKCSPGLRGRYVSVLLPGVNKELTICEVMVNRNPTENIALQKPTSQSSTHDSKASNRAVDGNSYGVFNGDSCTHTGALDSCPWWRVDLGSSKPVSEIFIVNRAILTERLKNFEIRVGDSLDDDGNYNPRCGGIHTMKNLYKKSFYCKPRKTGRYVNIRLLPIGIVGTLTLCEVEIYSQSKAIIDKDQADPTVVQGLPIALTCPVFGYPEPFVAWVRDGVVYQNTTATSVFKKNQLIENRNQSKWECIVSNIHGSDFHQFHIKGVSRHRMCAKYQVLAGKRTLNDVMSSPDPASNDTALNESVWYRLKHPVTSQSMQIPESCTPSMLCSAQASGWLLGSHPAIEDGVVHRTVCFNWDGDCCRYNTTILVRKCHGFYVYKLQKPSFDVQAGYCAETSNALSPSVSFKQVRANDGTLYAVKNHVIHTEPDLDLVECIAVCLSHQSCKSINYDSSGKLCEMNNAARSEVSSIHWIERQGNLYYERIQISEWDEV